MQLHDQGNSHYYRFLYIVVAFRSFISTPSVCYYIVTIIVGYRAITVSFMEALFVEVP